MFLDTEDGNKSVATSMCCNIKYHIDRRHGPPTVATEFLDMEDGKMSVAARTVATVFDTDTQLLVCQWKTSLRALQQINRAWRTMCWPGCNRHSNCSSTTIRVPVARCIPL